MEATEWKWEYRVPSALQDRCVEVILDHMEYIAHPSFGSQHELRRDLQLPFQICEALLKGLHDMLMLTKDTVSLFRDPTRTRLRKLNLRELCTRRDVDDCLLQDLLQHKPYDVNISGFRYITSQQTIDVINENSQNLVSLCIDADILLSVSPVQDTIKANASGDSSHWNAGDSVFKCPKLRSLGLHRFRNKSSSVEEYLSRDLVGVLRPLSGQLVCLDLSHSDLDISDFQLLENLSNLQSLILHNVPLQQQEGDLYGLERVFKIIASLSKIRCLDISMGSTEEPFMYPHPEANLTHLVSRLPRLTHLDLSGTNLAGFVGPEEEDRALRHRVGLDAKYEKSHRCAIPGLEGRHLEFLGLLGCAHDACERQNLPADRVTGDFMESQVLLAARAYVDREAMLEKALNSLFRIFRYEECYNQREALEVILDAMYRHAMDKHIQICGSASLFYIVKGEKESLVNAQLKVRIVRILITAMENHSSDATMMRNGSLTLCHFVIPQDVLFIYKRLVRVLLGMISPDNRPESFTQKVGICLLNSLACQVDGKEKLLVGDLGLYRQSEGWGREGVDGKEELLVGDLGAVQVDRARGGGGRGPDGKEELLVGDLGAVQMMLKIIRVKLDHGQYDEVLEIAWSAMWNVTDETATNCERFIENSGMDTFLECLQTYPNKAELLRNMMGLLGNVAEVAFLRPKLMKTNFVTVFSDLLESQSDGIEVSYNACGVLSHMISDGQSAWVIAKPQRHDVLRKMSAAINRWKLKTRRNINYRSFEPILRLLKHDSAPESQHWAVWALCNLTKMYRSKYCPLLVKEGGIELLTRVTQNLAQYQEIRDLAQEVINRCERFQEEPENHSDDEDLAGDVPQGDIHDDM